MIKKYQFGKPIEVSDNTRIQQNYLRPVVFTLKQWELELLRKNLANRREAIISSDNRSTWLKLLDLKKALLAAKQEQEIKNQESAMKAASGLMSMTAPTTYIKLATNPSAETVTGSHTSDFLLDAGLLGGPSLLRSGLRYATPVRAFRLSRELNNSLKNNFNLESLKPTIRTRIGEIEIDNPQLAYRQGNNIASDFIKNNKVLVPEGDYGERMVTTKSGFTFNFGKSFQNPMFALGRLWYGIPEKSGDLLVTAEPLALATKSSAKVNSHINGTFDVRNLLTRNNVGIRRVMNNPDQLNITNTSAYTYIPGYGYLRIIPEPSTAYFGNPTLNFLKFVGNPKLGRETAANSTFYGVEKNLVEELKNSGVDLNKIPKEAINLALNKRRDLIKQTGQPTVLVPTKSTIFNPYIIDYNGKMHINWDDILILHKYGGKMEFINKK